MNNHFIMSNHDGSSVFEKLDAPEFTPLEYPGWFGQAMEASGVFCFTFKIEPGAGEYPLHAAPEAWLGYVIAGGGELFSGTPGGEKLDSVSFRAGDFITFEPETQHAWKNGPEQSKILFMKVA